MEQKILEVYMSKKEINQFQLSFGPWLQITSLQVGREQMCIHQPTSLSDDTDEALPYIPRRCMTHKSLGHGDCDLTGGLLAPIWRSVGDFLGQLVDAEARSTGKRVTLIRLCDTVGDHEAGRVSGVVLD